MFQHNCEELEVSYIVSGVPVCTTNEIKWLFWNIILAMCHSGPLMHLNASLRNVPFLEEWLITIYKLRKPHNFIFILLGAS